MEVERKSSAREWLELVDSGLAGDELKVRLQDIHRRNLPDFAEIVVNPDCMNRCRHCIYPENYACFNKALSAEEWKGIIDDMYSRLEFRHFIFGGRGMNETIIEIVRYINSEYSDVRVGLIVEAFGLEKFWDEIKGLEIYHLDVSVDGLRRGHDLQRNRDGGFDLTVKMLQKVLDGPVKDGNFGKVSVLSTLTTINRDEILPCFKFLNSELGLKNFFVSPVVIFNNRPDASLKLSSEEVLEFVREMESFISELDGAYVGFSCYEDELGFWMRERAKDLFDRFETSGDYFEFGSESGKGVEFHFFWYPAAINSCREFIMNTNGDVFTGYVQVYGKIPEENIFGNVREIGGTREEFFEKIIGARAFDFFVGQVEKIRDFRF